MTTKEQLPRLKELEAHGVPVTVVKGGSYAAEYAAVGRHPAGGAGLQHSKAVASEKAAIVGSCNWTTASRANHELGIKIVLDDMRKAELADTMRKIIAGGQPLKEAEVLLEQRSAQKARKTNRED